MPPSCGPSSPCPHSNALGCMSAVDAPTVAAYHICHSPHCGNHRRQEWHSCALRRRVI